METSGHSDFKLLESRTVRKYCFIKHTNMWYFVMEDEADQDKVYQKIFLKIF